MQGPKYKFPSSHSSPQLNLSDDEVHALVDPQLSLSGPEIGYLPYFNTQDKHGIRIKADYLFTEARPEWDLQETHYLTSEDRKHYEVIPNNGIFEDVYGKLLHGIYLYVIFPNDLIYACPVGTQRFHSYLSSALNVKGAGLLYCQYGMLITASNESGHYKPTHLEMRPALSTLFNKTLYPFVFEDHSTLDQTKPFQDVKFFSVVNADQQSPLMLIKTKESLKSTIDSATAQAELMLKMRYASIEEAKKHANNDHDYGLSSYYLDENDVQEQVAPTSTAISDPMIDPLTEDPNAFMKHTCLARLIRPGTQSRFFAHKKLNM
jgi:hypothetical protein